MKKQNESKHCIVAIGAIFIILVLYGISWWGINHFIPSTNDRGLFGDKFGAVNALFSGLAFAGLIYTIILQKDELSLQREELKQTREEMKQQTMQFEEQNKIIQIQRFETTFFNMMQYLQDITQGLTITLNKAIIKITPDPSGKRYRVPDTESIVFSGKQVFEETYRNGVNLKNLIQSKGINGYNESSAVSLYDHYFRYIYRIMKFVDNSFLEYKDCYKYMAILRSQLSRYELVWLYYNGLSDYGKEKMKPLMEKYAMLKNLRKELIIDTDHNVGHYSSSAFGLES